MSAAERGFTLVEVLVAMAIIGIAVVPLLTLLPGILTPATVSDTDLRLGAAGVRKMEELTNRLRADITSVTSGAQACTDLPRCRFAWTIITELSSGSTGVGSLKTLSVTACVDANANSVCDAAESQVRFDAKVTSRP